MKLKIIALIIVILTSTLTILLFIEDTPSTQIIISPKIYSIVKSSDTESFGITFLVNDTESYYFNKDFVANIFLTSDKDEIIPLNIIEIDKSVEYYPIENHKYYYVTINLSIGFKSDDYLICLEEAYLNITYSNSKVIKLHIGEFNYLFSEEINSDFSLNDLFSTHKTIEGIDTASGLFLNLGNLTDNNIVITKIIIGSKDVLANNFYLTELFEDINLGDYPKDILKLDDYNFFVYGDYSSNRILLRKNNEIDLYVPFSYIGSISFLHRFYVSVEYIVNGEEKVFIIDDFPFINTSCYKEELEKGFAYYEYEN